MKLSSRIKPLVVLALVVCLCGFSPVWFIVDPVRDANWVLKQIQKGIAWADEAIRNEATLVQNEALSQYETLMKEKYASANIRAQTTATSITHNNATEDRYTIDMLAQQVCSYMQENKESKGVFNKQDDCDSRTGIIVSSIESVLKNEPISHQQFVARSDEHKALSAQGVEEKRQIDGYAKTINNAAEALKEYTVIDTNTYSDIQSVLDLVFLNNIKAPNVNNILRGHEWDVNDLRTFQISLLLKEIVLDENVGRVKDTTSNKKAMDTSLIDQGSWERHQQRVESANTATSSYKVTRQRALILSARLSSKYKRLKYLRDLNSLMALKLKAQQDKGEL